MKNILFLTFFLIPLFSFGLSENTVVFSNTIIDSSSGYFALVEGNDLSDTLNVTKGANYKSGLILNGQRFNKLTLYADRKGSTDPVTWVRKQLASQGILWTDDSMASAIKDTTPPEKLNFAFKINLRFWLNGFYNAGYTCDNVIVAQGHTGNNNNWWIFTNTTQLPYSKVPENIVMLSCTDVNTSNPVNIYVKATATNKFQINMAPMPPESN